MWANSVWGFFGLGVTFALARVGMIWESGYGWLGHWFTGLSALCFVVSGMILVWPFVERKFNPEQPVYPDMPVHEVIDYIVNDSRAKLRRPGPRVRMTSGPASGCVLVQGGVEHDDAFERVVQAVSIGHLRAWGRKPVGFFSAQNFTTDLKEIPKAYWNSATLRHPFCFHASEQVQSRSLDGSKEVPLYRNITFNKKEVQAIWPKKPFVQRLFVQMKKGPRIGYHGPYNAH
jgi:hypothetical protein